MNGHAIQQPRLVEILVDGQGCDLIGALDDGRPESELIQHRHFESFHQRARILAETLLARHELVAVMLVLHLPLLHVVGEADIVMRRQEQACAFPIEPPSDGVDLPRLESIPEIRGDQAAPAMLKALAAAWNAQRLTALSPSRADQGRMVRRVLLAALLCLAVWATVDRVACSRDGIDAAASAVSCAVSTRGAAGGSRRAR